MLAKYRTRVSDSRLRLSYAPAARLINWWCTHKTPRWYAIVFENIENNLLIFRHKNLKATYVRLLILPPCAYRCSTLRVCQWYSCLKFLSSTRNQQFQPHCLLVVVLLISPLSLFLLIPLATPTNGSMFLLVSPLKVCIRDWSLCRVFSLVLSTFATILLIIYRDKSNSGGRDSVVCPFIYVYTNKWYIYQCIYI